jgi:hypothetical protein
MNNKHQYTQSQQQQSQPEAIHGTATKPITHLNNNEKQQGYYSQLATIMY